jgi:protease-4
MIGNAMTLSVVSLLSLNAYAAEIHPDRPVLPAMSLEEDGALSMWRNPANLGFDPDPSVAFLYGAGLGGDGTSAAPRSFAFASSGGPLGLGASYLSQANQPDWWAISAGLALPLGRNVWSGVHLGFQLPPGADNNFTTVDAGIGWRPLHWWGISAVGQNLDNSGQSGFDRRIAGGTTFRVAGNFLELGGEYRHYTNADAIEPNHIAGTVTMEPMDGVLVRLSADQIGSVGLGLELGFGGSRMGVHGSSVVGTNGAGTTPFAMGSIVDDPDAGKLFSAKASVPEFTLNEAYPYQPTSSLFSRKGESYLHLLGRLKHAANSKETKALLIQVDWSPFSFAQVEEVLSVLDEARSNQKKVIVYLDEDASNSAYMIASGADVVLMNPAQQLMLVGLSAELMFFREALDMVGVHPQFTRRSQYKSAAENMTETEASAPQREQMNALLDDMNGRMIARIAQGRDMPTADVQGMIDRGPFTTDEALANGLIDGVAYPDELHKVVKQHTGRLSFFDDSYRERDTHSGWLAPKEIAVVYVDGMITSGPSQGPGLLGGSRTAGSATIVDQLQQAKESNSVKAVVLRVDSPGGSAMASDEIWRAVAEVKRAGKPIVVSMGGVAASGGYYVSAGADAIYAQPSTVTGSIGVIAGKFSFDKLYDKLGINYETYIRGRNAAMFSSSKPFDDAEFAACDRMVGDTYAQFISKVAHGRSMDIENVDSVAGGRVWSGERAKLNNLVDEIGGFHDAVERARMEANIEGDPELVTFSGQGSGQEELGRIGVNLMQRVLFGPGIEGRTAPELELLRRMQLMGDEKVWVMMPYRLDVQ